MAKNIILVDGNALPSSSVNEMGMQRIINNATPTSTTSTTYQTFATLAVPAGEVKHHIMVNVTMIASWSYESSVGDGFSSQLDILIGEAASETSRYEKTIGQQNGNGCGKVSTTLTYYYEPTADEKTNGFNVIIKGKTTDIGSGGSNYCGYDKCDIFAG